MLRRALLPVLATFLAMLALGVVAGDDRHRPARAFAQLNPINEVPSISSGAHGRFKATIDRENQTISYELSYEGLEDTALQAHIHIGQRHTNGGVSVFLCGNPPTVPPATFPQPPACPLSPATITGTLTAASVVGPAAQGVAPSQGGVNEFDELVEAILSGATYANVTPRNSPAAEFTATSALTKDTEIIRAKGQAGRRDIAVYSLAPGRAGRMRRC